MLTVIVSVKWKKQIWFVVFNIVYTIKWCKKAVSVTEKESEKPKYTKLDDSEARMRIIDVYLIIDTLCPKNVTNFCLAITLTYTSRFW